MNRINYEDFAKYILQYRIDTASSSDVRHELIANALEDMVVTLSKKHNAIFSEPKFRKMCNTRKELMPATKARTQGGSVELRGSRLEVKTPFFIGGKGNGSE